MPVYVNVCTHAQKFGNVHETVFKNRFGNHACAFRHGQQSHELCLQIGWKARKRFGNDVFADKLFPVASTRIPRSVGMTSTPIFCKICIGVLSV